MNKSFLTAAVILSMAMAPSGALANLNSQQTEEYITTTEIVEPASETSVEEQSEPLALQEPNVFPNDNPESKIAKKMTQAEKNRNAAENDGWGGAITIIAMCIVISALVVLAILFQTFGKISEAILKARKKKAKAAAAHAPTDDHSLASGEVIAAISLALTEYFSVNHDEEDTILTLQRLQKAYSPWNSKIYNLRHTQDHRRNPSTEIKFNESKRIQI